MKNWLVLILSIMVLGGCNNDSSPPKPERISLEALNNSSSESLRDSSSSIIFTALFDRCSEFGWISEEDISACIKQEAYRDLQMHRQKYEMRRLEERVANASTPTPTRELAPSIFEILNQYAQVKQTEQMKKDIQRLKAETRTLAKRQRTQANLRYLYQGRGN